MSEEEILEALIENDLEDNDYNRELVEVQYKRGGYFISGSLYNTCDLCGGDASWCSCCEVFSSDCCCDYGTCQCS